MYIFVSACFAPQRDRYRLIDRERERERARETQNTNYTLVKSIK